MMIYIGIGDIMFKDKRKFFIGLALLCFWLILIYILSNQVGSESSSLSNGVLEKIVKLFNSNISEKDLLSIYSNLGLLIRKCAHLMEYLILGLLFYNCFYYLKITNKMNISYSIFTCMIYSITDELHQFFIPGRCCSIYDFMIDSLGVVLGVYICKYLKKFDEHMNNDKI